MDPLAQLADIHLPDPVSQAPLAPGWWLLLATIILVCLWAGTKLTRRYRVNKVKRQVQTQLQGNALNLEQITQLLKFACLHYFSREQVANLYGQAWLDYLTGQLPEKQQTKFREQATLLADGHYQAEQPAPEQCQDAQQAALLWITHALPHGATNSNNKEAG